MTGEETFQETNPDKLREVTSFLSQFDTMKKTVKSPQSPEARSMTKKLGSDKDSDTDLTFVQSVGCSIGSFFCDVIEGVKKVVKSAVKIVIRVVGSVVRIASKP